MVCEACSQSGNAYSSGDAKFCTHCGRPLVQPAWNAFAGRLLRPRDGRMLGGVCAGLSAAYGWDPTLVRILTAVTFFCGFPLVGVVYIAAWVIMPNTPLVCMTPAGPQQGFGGGFGGSAPVA